MRETRSGTMKVSEAYKQVKWVVNEILLLYRLAYELICFLLPEFKWVDMLVRLYTFAWILAPAWWRIGKFYFFSPRVVRNIRYGPYNRSLLDVYLPVDKDGNIIDVRTPTGGKRDPDCQKWPVVIFLTGGAWIIGYKAWGSLMGKVLQSNGVVYVCIDRREFPQGRMSSMIDDTNDALTWVFKNIEYFGGDLDNVFLMGQSAGAQLGAIAMLRQAQREHHGAEDLGWKASDLRGFIGVSGPYNIRGQMEHFHSRGLPRNVLSAIFEGVHMMDSYSPAVVVGKPPYMSLADANSGPTPCARLIPPVFLFHGMSDRTLPSISSEEFARALEAAQIPVTIKHYPSKSHTDPIVEEPLLGGTDLLADVVDVVDSLCVGEVTRPVKPEKYEVSVSPFLVWLSRFINPF